MPTRQSKRPGAVTRLPAAVSPTSDSLLPSIDTSGFGVDELRSALADRGLATTGDATALAQRLEDAVSGALTAAAAPAPVAHAESTGD
jgi:hypothetical protein